MNFMTFIGNLPVSVECEITNEIVSDIEITHRDSGKPLSPEMIAIMTDEEWAALKKSAVITKAEREFASAIWSC